MVLNESKAAPAFYVLEHSQVEKTPAETEFYYIGDKNQRGAPHCGACGKCIGLLSRVPPYAVELELWERRYGDLVSGVGCGMLVSERFRILYNEHGLAGLNNFDPVRIAKVKKHKRFEGSSPDYHHVVVARSLAAIDQSASGFEWESPPSCPVCHLGTDLQRWQRIVLQPGTWTGEDIFIARGLTGTYMASQRFKDFCEQYRIQNAHFIPAEEYEYDFYPWENAKRAQELATMPLGEELQEKIRSNGERLRYYGKRNELLIIYPDGRLSLFRPLEGVKYWDKQ